MQKHGAALTRLTKEHKGISGRGEGKLTKKVINTLQNYYGMTIRASRGTSIQQVKIAIVEVIHHCVRKISDDGVEDLANRHKYCPNVADTWCRYQKSINEGADFQGDRVNIGENIYQLIRPVWLRLSEKELSEKCLHGRTQNVNEAFNALV